MLSLFILLHRLSQHQPLGPLTLVPVSLWQVHIIILTSPCSLPSCISPCASTGISHVSKEPWFFLLENSLETKIWRLVDSSTTWVSLPLDLPTGTKLGNISMQTDISIHLHIYLSLCICIYVCENICIYKTMSSFLIPLIPIQYQKIHFTLLFKFISPFSTCEKPGSYYSKHIYYFLNPSILLMLF